MVKLIGGLCIVFAFALLGLYQAMQLTNRGRQIRQLIAALHRLETEIRYGFTPLPEALQAAARQLDGPLAGLLRTAAAGLCDGSGRSAEECWRLALGVHWPQTAMKQNEREIMQRLGGTLGISDRTDQEKHLQLAVLQLQAEEANACEDERKYGRMWRSLGLLGGLLIAILMY